MLELNKIYNEDCLEGMKRIDDKSIDMILCDLPYGTTACKWDNIIPFAPMWEQYNRIIKDHCPIVLFASQPFTTKLISSNINMFKYELIWNKITATGMTSAKYQPMKQHENIIVFGIGKVNYYPIMEKMDKPETYRCYTKSDSAPLRYNDNALRIRDHKYPKSIINVSNANKKGNLHPTQKPVALFEYLIKTYTSVGDLVLDNCMGSGTTAVASINTNRNFIGFENNQEYFESANRRIEETYAKQVVMF